MQDTYGDGWNGGNLQVFINNVLVGNYSATNFGSTSTFQVCNGDNLRLFYVAGSYENENIYELYDPAWNLLLANGPNPPTGNVLISVGNCSGTVLPNNNPCTAMPIDTGQCLVVTNVGLQSSGLKPGCADFQGSDFWFEMQVPPSGNLSFETDNGGLNDTGLAIWRNNNCTGALRLLGCDDDSGNGYFSFLTLYDLVPNETIYIQVFGYGGATGSFQLCVEDLGKITLDSSELPIFMINTVGQTIVPDNKINCLLDVKYNGVGNITYTNGPANVYSGNIGIEIRGASSSGYPQTPYGFETRTLVGANNNVPILGMPAENDWVLLSNYNDRSLVRNSLAFKLFEEMGHYSVKTSLCEVLIDSAYRGIYLFAEKIKQDNDRVDIGKLNPIDTVGDQLTGGYILQQNYWDVTTSFQSNYSPIDHPGFDVHFVYEYPKPDEIVPAQKTYIAGYVDSLETALYSTNFTDPVTGYRKFLDVKSFIDYFLVNELARSNDGFKKSVFFNKNQYSKGGKLKAGPVWDFDWAWKNMYGCSIFEGFTGAGWAHHINDCPTDNYSTGWYVRLLQDSTFRNELRCAYEDYRQTIFDTTYIFAYMDSIENRVQNAQSRHFQKWPILGISGPAPEVGAIATTYHAEMDTLKAWINLRLQWLDANIPGLCLVSNVSQTSNLPNQLNYFPNPSTGKVHFEGVLNSKTPLKMSIYDITGRIIDMVELQEGNSLNFDYEFKGKGVFCFAISNDAGLVQQGKIIIL